MQDREATEPEVEQTQPQGGYEYFVVTVPTLAPKLDPRRKTGFE